SPTIMGWYENAGKQERLTNVNLIFLRGITELLGFRTRLARDSDYPVHGDRMARLLSIARAAGADRYLSGPSARAYFEEAMFTEAGITPEWMSYDGYPEYAQLH